MGFDQRRTRITALSLLVVALALLQSAANGLQTGTDVLRLRDGNILRGSLVSCDERTVKFRTIAGVGSYSRDGVVSITLGQWGSAGRSQPPPPDRKTAQAVAAPVSKPSGKAAKTNTIGRPSASQDLPPSRDISTGPNAAIQSSPPDQNRSATAVSELTDGLAPLRRVGLVPQNAKPNDPVIERDLTAMIGLITKNFSKEVDNPITPEKPTAPVSRARALTAIVKIGALQSDVEARRSPAPDQMPPDGAKIPAWAKPYVCIAVEQTWWPAAKPFDANGVATWQFMGAILERTPYVEIGPPPAKPAVSTDPEAYTGLIVDARDIPVERSMSVRILSKAGVVVYPHPMHLPDLGFVEDHGMAAYITDPTELKRVGKKPLTVKAVDVAAGGNDVVVTDDVADLIQEANRTGKFLWRWAVSILHKPR